MASENPLLLVQDATVRYLDKILFPELSFELLEGRHWAVTGKSGSGKSALLHTLLGNRFNIVRGAIRYPFFEAFCTAHLREEEREAMPIFRPRDLMAIVTQQAHFRNRQHMSDFYYQQRFNAWDSEDAATVLESLNETFSELHPVVRSAGIRFPRDWILENLRLTHLQEKTLIKLSNGETRRLLFAQALAAQPLILLLDMPFTGLDAESRPFFQQLLAAIAAKGTSVILATSPAEIPDFVTDVLALSGGRIAGSWPREAYPGPAVEEVAGWRPDPEKLFRVRTLSRVDGEASSPVLKLDHVHVTYGKNQILDDVSWEVLPGEKWALLGPNGAGKSTLLSLVSGDHPQAYANEIHLFGKKRGSGESIWDIKKRIGFLSPEMHQYFLSSSVCEDAVLSGFTDTMTVLPKKIGDRERELAAAWMALLEIAPLARTKFKEASAGSQRLVLLARALVKSPPLLILDEPCQGLDEIQKAHFKRIIETLFAGTGSTLIYVTHYREEIPSSVTRILLLDGGRVVSSEDRP